MTLPDAPAARTPVRTAPMQLSWPKPYGWVSPTRPQDGVLPSPVATKGMAPKGRNPLAPSLHRQIITLLYTTSACRACRLLRRYPNGLQATGEAAELPKTADHQIQAICDGQFSVEPPEMRPDGVGADAQGRGHGIDLVAFQKQADDLGLSSREPQAASDFNPFLPGEDRGMVRRRGFFRIRVCMRAHKEGAQLVPTQQGGCNTARTNG